MCHVAKNHSLSLALCTPLPVPTLPWVGVSMNFILDLSRTQRNKYLIYEVVD